MEATTDPTAATTAATPAPLAWLDGSVVPAETATVPLLDDGFLRGDGVFEAVLVRRGRTHALGAHLERLARSAAALELPLPEVGHVIPDLVAAWGEHDGVARVIVTRSGTVRGLIAATRWPTSLALGVVEAPWRTAISGVKTLSYAANQLATRAAQTMGADDALIVDEGIVHEVPTAAVCLVRGGRIETPDQRVLPILDSVTLRSLAEVIEVTRGMTTLTGVQEADELFVVSATRPVLPVHALLGPGAQQRSFPVPGPTTAAAQAALAAHIDGNLDA